MPTPPPGNKTTTFQVGTYNSTTDTFTLVLDLNDFNVFWIEHQSMKFPQPKKTFVKSSNVRVPGEVIQRYQYQNRHIQVSVRLKNTTTQTILNSIRSLMTAIENPPYVLRIAQPGATVYTYADVLAVTHNIPADPQALLALIIPSIQIDFECRPGLRGDRIIAQNLAFNPGFEAPSNLPVSVFADTLSSSGAYLDVTYTGAYGTVLTDAPWRLYPLNDLVGAMTAKDRGSQAQNGTLSGTVTFGQASLVSGYPTALFDGTTGFITMPGPGTLPTANTSWSLEAWVNIAANPGTTRTIAAFGTSATAKGVAQLLITSAGIVQADVNGSTVSSAAGISTGAWHHLCATYNGTTLTLYLDGASVGTPTTPGPLVLTGAFAVIGASAAASPLLFFPGTMAMVGVYPVALSATRVSAHYTGGHTTGVMTQDVVHYSDLVLYDGPVRYYRMDEASGTVLHDASPNAQNGTLSSTFTLAQTGALQGDTDTAILFNGGQSTVPTTGLATGAAPWTMECWVKLAALPSTGNSCSLMFFGTANVANQSGLVQIFNNAGSASALATIWGTSAGSGGGSVVISTWYHVVAVYNGLTLYIYLNGNQMGSAAAASSNITLGTAQIAGTITGNVAMNGTLDECAWYNIALAPNRIQAHYRAGIDQRTYGQVVQQDGAMAQWRLAEASGTTAFDSIYTPNVTDNGTYNGGFTLAQTGPVTGDTAVLFNGTTGYMDAPIGGITGCSWGTFYAPYIGTSITPLSVVEAALTNKAAGFTQWFVPWNGAFTTWDNFLNSTWNAQLSMLNTAFNNGIMPMIVWSSYDQTQPGGAANTILQQAYTCANIAAGTFDTYIQTWATGAAAWGHPMLLRFDAEMNGNGWSPWQVGVNGNTAAQYVSMWQHVHQIFVNAGATNVKWVWCPNTEFAAASASYASLYPGDAYVDYIGLDGYNNGTVSGGTWKTFTQIYATAAGPGSTNGSIQDITALTAKPLLICEIGCVEQGGNKAAWIADTFATQIPITFPQVRGVAWFDSNGGGGLDWRINSTAAAQTAFQQYIGINPYYGGGPNSFGGFSAELWFNMTSIVAAKQTLAGTADPTSANKGWQINLAASATSISFTVGNGSANATATYTFTFVITTWYHVLCTYNHVAGQLTICINGVQQATAVLAAAGPIATPATNLEYGRNITAVNQFFSGKVAHGALYAYPLSTAQALAHFNASTATAPGTLANSMVIPAGGQVAFGPTSIWQSMNNWQSRFRYLGTASASYTWYLHYNDATDNMYVFYQVSSSTLFLQYNLANAITAIASTVVTLVPGCCYWLQITEFPGIGGGLNVVLAADGAGGVPGAALATLTGSVGTGVTWQTAGPVATTGKAEIASAVGSLPLVSPSSPGFAVQAILPLSPSGSGNNMQLWGPGAWVYNGLGSAVTNPVIAAGSWEQPSAVSNVSSANTYPNGPVTSYGCARIDAPPTGTFDAYWHCTNAGLTIANPAVSWPVPASSGQILRLAAMVKATGLSSTAITRIAVQEYDSNGDALGSVTTVASITGPIATWQQLAGTYTLSNLLPAYIDVQLRCQDATADGSANATIWFDNVQAWNQTTTGQTTMAYHESRFGQAPAQLMISGIQGDMPAPVVAEMAAYLASWTNGQTASVWLGRRVITTPGMRLIQPTTSSACTIDSGSYGGYNCTANLGPLLYSTGVETGTYHLLGRAKTANASYAVVWIAPQVLIDQIPAGSAANIYNPVVGEWQGANAFGFSGQNVWNVLDTGQLVLPPFPIGSLGDSSQLGGYVSTTSGGAGGSQLTVGFIALLPVDADLFMASLTDFTAVTAKWLYVYWDGITGATTYSQESNPLANPAHAGPAQGTLNLNPLVINPAADTTPTLDPTLQTANSGGLGVNQWLLHITDNNALEFPVAVDFAYSPLYLYPR